MKRREQIIESAIRLFEQKGLSFTMDDLAAGLRISKKSIYREFSSKEELLLSVCDNAFSEIYSLKKSLAEKDTDLSTRLSEVMIALPADLVKTDWRKLDELEKLYPRVYERMLEYLDNGWEVVFDLFRKGKEEGVLREFDPLFIKQVYNASLRSFLSDGQLTQNNISYTQALNGLIDIIMNGLRRRDHDLSEQ